MEITIEKPSDLDKYEVNEKSEHWIACNDKAIKGPAFDGPMYYIPTYADLNILIPMDGVNFFMAGGVIKTFGAGAVNNSLIYNRLTEEF